MITRIRRTLCRNWTCLAVGTLAFAPLSGCAQIIEALNGRDPGDTGVDVGGDGSSSGVRFEDAILGGASTGGVFIDDSAQEGPDRGPVVGP